MDSWTVEQVENMRKVGNTTSNKIYNPQNKKASIPIDVDEVDSAMERFIRAKYISASFSNGTQKTGISAGTSLDENPPPLPPKGKFGLRSASSLFPLSSKAKKQIATETTLSPNRELSRRSPSPRLVNKPSKVFGASIEYDTGDTDYKLGRLRDMGFMDNSRNAMILKGTKHVHLASTNPFGPQMNQLDAFSQAFQGMTLAAPNNLCSPTIQAAFLPIPGNLSPGFANNPFTRSPTRIQSPTLGQIPEQSQYVTSPSQQTNNPFYTQTQYQQATPHSQAQGYSQRPDNASILALFNYPQLAPQPAPQPEQPHPQATAVNAVPASVFNPQQPRSVSTPLPGNKNPFTMSTGMTSPTVSSPLASKDIFAGAVTHGSRDSIALGLDMASWSNSGRHSPDAFASLSARHG
ncbi:unnamed protein product [Parascedosporium putredinis]|uniref:Arf-GAP domain-containing protein n=1 Tax=Parascedosporium putredinis TaxID=1442378 RepID=A0A9P1M9H8_9PEZI|nr:unnamed protein product [Parascedosporium putredinis]CAI7995685.1 unnamed protein product [Parascedosporium putredinis]